MSKKDRSPSLEQVEPRGQQRGQRHQPDARIRRTRERLGHALLELMEDKSVQDVTVGEVLRRASVGRSTFYLHYRDKDDLLLSQLEWFLETMSTLLSVRKEQSHRVVPVTEMFAHIASAMKLYRTLADSGHLTTFFDLAQGYFARGIEKRLMESKRLPNLPPSELAARSVALAGSMLALLRWWLGRGAKESPRTLDELFHRMVWNGFRDPL